MAGKLRREQRHGDVAGLDRGEEADDVVDALRCQDRHPVTPRGDLLQASTDGPQPGTQLGPGQLDHLAVGIAGVVQKAVRDGIADVGDMPVQERHQADALWQNDFAVRVEVVSQLRPAQPAAVAFPGTKHVEILRDKGSVDR